MPKAKAKKALLVRVPADQSAAGKRRRPDGPVEHKATQPARPAKRRKPGTAGAVGSSAGGQWRCHGVIDRQAAEAVERLVQAAETQRGGSTIKSLTLAPHVVHKKPTHAVTCETLRCASPAAQRAWVAPVRPKCKACIVPHACGGSAV
jgi:hypothetical protein